MPAGGAGSDAHGRDRVLVFVESFDQFGGCALIGVNVAEYALHCPGGCGGVLRGAAHDSLESGELLVEILCPGDRLVE